MPSTRAPKRQPRPNEVIAYHVCVYCKKPLIFSII
jgi:hypothetical protein